jgi:hypothetical protein
MRTEIALAGFVLTPDEWDALDDWARAQLLAVALRRDEPWVAHAPPPRPREADEYESYQLLVSAA